MSTHSSQHPRHTVFALMAAGTVTGIAGTDLVLPAVPSLPDILGGSISEAQLVLAAYVSGIAAGLILFGALGDYLRPSRILVASSLSLAAVSFACIHAADIRTLVALRALQGLLAAAPAVYAPGILRQTYDGLAAIRVIGMLGSIESVVPALAPIVGLWLLSRFGWTASFHVIGWLALALAVAFALAGRHLPHSVSRKAGSYRALLLNREYLAHALGYAFILGGLLIFVFSAPALFVTTMGGSIGDFVVMQVTGIAAFIISANLSGRLAARFGERQMVITGSATSAASSIGIIATTPFGFQPLAIALLFIPMNIGIGVSGPVRFVAALKSSAGDDARAAALLILMALGTAAVGTACAAPLISSGIAPVLGVAVALQLLALFLAFTSRTRRT